MSNNHRKQHEIYYQKKMHGRFACGRVDFKKKRPGRVTGNKHIFLFPNMTPLYLRGTLPRQYMPLYRNKSECYHQMFCNTCRCMNGFPMLLNH